VADGSPDGPSDGSSLVEAVADGLVEAKAAALGEGREAVGRVVDPPLWEAGANAGPRIASVPNRVTAARPAIAPTIASDPSRRERLVRGRRYIVLNLPGRWTDEWSAG
jgi:hypothetical protein